MGLTMKVDERRLGRLPAADERDRQYLLPRKISTRKYRYWSAYEYSLDQGMYPHCVAYSWSHFLVDSPTPHSLDYPPHMLYHEAQLIDEWPGENYDGTSVRAGAKVLQTLGRIGEYQWAFDLPTVIGHLLEVGPVIVGTNWYEQMFVPELIKGTKTYKISIGGEVVGGHAYKLDGVNVDAGYVRLKNSWGTEWGNKGFARMSFVDLSRLISEDGEACRAVEVRH